MTEKQEPIRPEILGPLLNNADYRGEFCDQVIARLTYLAGVEEAAFANFATSGELDDLDPAVVALHERCALLGCWAVSKHKVSPN